VTAPHPVSASLDYTAAAKWPLRAAAHLLGAGLVLAVLVALPVAPTDLDRHQLPKETVVHLTVWLAVLLARPWPAVGLRRATIWSMSALAALTVASAVGASNHWLAWRAAALLISGCAALLTARHVAALGAVASLQVWCCIAGVVGVASGLAQAYGFDSPLFATTRLPGGTFGNRNFMAHFCALALPLFIMTVLTTRARALAWIATLGSAAFVAAIVLSRSRAAWIAVAVAVPLLAAACLLARRRGTVPMLRQRATGLAVTMVVTVIAAVVLPNRLSWKSASPYSDTLTGLTQHDEGSGHGRLLQYRNTLHLALIHPVLGIGPGNWPVRYGDVAPPNDPTWVYADPVPINPWPSSDWMALVSETGFAATLIALLFGASLAWRGLLAIGGHGDRVIAGAALLATLAIVFIEGNLDAVLLLPVPLLFVAMTVAVLMQRSEPPTDSVPPPPHRWANWALILLLGVGAIRSSAQTAAYVVAGNGRTFSRLWWASRIDPGSYPIRIALAQRGTCASVRGDIVAVIRMAPTWPATIQVARRCGVRLPR
jgi:hypothetical protein